MRRQALRSAYASFYLQRVDTGFKRCGTRSGTPKPTEDYYRFLELSFEDSIDENTRDRHWTWAGAGGNCWNIATG